MTPTPTTPTPAVTYAVDGACYVRQWVDRRPGGVDVYRLHRVAPTAAAVGWVYRRRGPALARGPVPPYLFSLDPTFAAPYPTMVDAIRALAGAAAT